MRRKTEEEIIAEIEAEMQALRKRDAENEARFEAQMKKDLEALKEKEEAIKKSILEKIELINKKDLELMDLTLEYSKKNESDKVLLEFLSGKDRELFQQTSDIWKQYTTKEMRKFKEEKEVLKAELTTLVKELKSYGISMETLADEIAKELVSDTEAQQGYKFDDRLEARFQEYCQRRDNEANYNAQEAEGQIEVEVLGGVHSSGEGDNVA